MIKSPRLLTVIALAGLTGLQPLNAQLNVPSDGSDGVLNIATNTVIDLSLATTGVWSQDNTTNAGNGLYDPEKWAVVFKYSSVSIASNATVTFLNHPSRPPVVWLVQSNAYIAGKIRLEGRGFVTAYPDYLFPGEPGPGGYRGAAYGPAGVGSGYGPGGTQNQTTGGASSYGGSYGNPQLSPLMGGSGAGSWGWAQVYQGPFAGPAGGGAILLAAGGAITVSGTISADGIGRGVQCNGNCDYVGSGGGAIKLIASQVLGAGTISAGKTRVEAVSVSPQLNINPNTTAVPPGSTPAIWPANTTPTVKILSVDTQGVPADPLASVLTSSDLSIGTNAPVTITLETKNFPPSGLVQVRINPKYAGYFTVTATNISGTFSNALWRTGATFPNGFCTLQARATSP